MLIVVGPAPDLLARDHISLTYEWGVVADKRKGEGPDVGIWREEDQPRRLETAHGGVFDPAESDGAVGSPVKEV